MKEMKLIGLFAISLIFGAAHVAAKKDAKNFETVPLSATGESLAAKYSALLESLEGDITRALPAVAAQKTAALQQARDAVQKAEAAADAAAEPLNKVNGAKGLVEHAKGKWIGGAKKGIAQAEAALKKATTPAERDAAKKELANWQKNLADGQAALKERQAALDKAIAAGQSAAAAHKSAQAALVNARANETAAAKALLADLERFLSSSQWDAKLVKATVLAEATPRGLAEFAQQSAETAELVEKLLADEVLMKEMLVAGGAKYGKYGRAMEIYAAIQKASPQAGKGELQRLALATALEHAKPITQSNPKDDTNAPTTVDPVKRYRHYEKAYLAGELDPAFKDFTAWEYRMVVDCDAPDEILAWGREMLRTYRPDHVATPNQGWRYVSSVRTDVRYGSQDVDKDLPALHQYQNIPMNGGVCGRRAFYGRFILKSFGIPTWGVTQKAHAALSRWTPKGWVCLLGGGYHASWWDKDEAPRSGTSFLLESQARENSLEYLKVLRAQWVSQILGETPYNDRGNDRKKQEPGFWSLAGHYQTVVLAAKAVELGPLGQELAEANAPEEKGNVEQPESRATERPVASPAGTIKIPATAYTNPSGRAATMPSATGGTQIHAGGGFKSKYTFEVPQAGKYALTARVATLQTGQSFLIAANGEQAPVEVAVPHTVGLWEQTPAVVVALNRGQNVLQFAVKDGSRGVTIKDFTLTAVR